MTKPAAASIILTAETVAAALAGLPHIAARLGGEPASWQVRDVADGNLNSVFLVNGPAGGVCVKQSLPYVRVAGTSWPLDINRISFEHAYAARLAPFVGKLAPEIWHYDPAQYLLVMEQLEPHIILRKALVAGVHYPKVPLDIAHYVAAATYHTSDLAVPFERKLEDIRIFSRNTDLQRITVDLVFGDPYVEVWRNKVIEPLSAWAAALRSDAALKAAVAKARRAYLAKAQSVIHGDLHSGSVMVTRQETRVIDGEFAFVGPSGFDIGNFIAHYVLAWFAKPYQPGYAEAQRASRQWIEAGIVLFWTEFRSRFLQIWRESTAAGAPVGDAFHPGHFAGPEGETQLEAARQAYVEDIWQDALAFMAIKIIRRVIGFAQVADFLVIGDEVAQATAKAAALAFARSVLVNPQLYPSVEALVASLAGFGQTGLDPA